MGHPSRFVGAVLVAGVVSHSFGRSTLPVLLPAIENDLQLSLADAGRLGTVYFAAYVVGLVGVTASASRLEPVTLLRGGTAIVAGGLVVYATAQGFGMLSAGAALAGLGGAGVWITAPAIVTADVDDRRRGAALAWVTGSMAIALIVIPQVQNVLSSVTGNPDLWRPIWVIEAVVTAGLLVVFIVLVRVPATARPEGGMSLTQLRRVDGWLPASLGYAAFAFVVAAFSNFLGLALSDGAGFGDSTVAWAFTTMALASVVGTQLFARLSDRVGRRRSMMLALVVMAIGALGVTIDHVVWVFASIALFGMASFSFPVLAAAFVRDHTEARAFAGAFGAMTIIYSAGGLTGPYLFGRVSESAGFTAAYLMVVGVALVGVALIARIPVTARHADAGATLVTR